MRDSNAPNHLGYPKEQNSMLWQAHGGARPQFRGQEIRMQILELIYICCLNMQFETLGQRRPLLFKKPPLTFASPTTLVFGL